MDARSRFRTRLVQLLAAHFQAAETLVTVLLPQAYFRMLKSNGSSPNMP